MESKTHTTHFLQKRKFFTVLPLLVLPFITLIFWALGGGKSNNVQAQQQTANGGLNLELPDAYLKDDKSLDKLSYYEKAASDSAKLEEIMKNDPFYRQQNPVGANETFSENDSLSSLQNKQNSLNEYNSLNPSTYGSHDSSDPNESKVYKKLNELNKALNQATIQSNKTTSYSDISRKTEPSVNSADIDRLEQMMAMSKNADNSEDPEMQQLNGMMEKIIDIQHPERMKDVIKQSSEANKGQVFPVTANSSIDNTSLLVNNKSALSNDTFKLSQLSNNGFFALNDDTENNMEVPNTIEAVIHETQTVVEGAIIKLRLMNDIYINGAHIPKNSFVFGIVSLNGERLNIKINNIRNKNFLFPVQLSVVGMDGIDGIYIPGAITRDVAKSSAQNAVQELGVTTLDPSFGAKAATAGIEAAKSILSKKAKLVKVTVKAGYQVLLKDEKQRIAS